MLEDFAGAFEHSLDAKGRVIIPACFRERLGERFTIALNSESSAIALYPSEKWEAIKQRLSLVRETDVRGMRYVRYILANAYTANNLDTQGRVVLPMKLRGYALDGREILFIGMTDHIEIWDTTRYTAQEQTTGEDFNDLLTYIDETYWSK